MNEITWKRTTAHNDPHRYGRVQDRLLYYSKSDEKTFNLVDGEYGEAQLSRYKYRDEHGPFRAENLTAPHFSATRTIEWRGVHPGADRQWRFSTAELDRLYAAGRILLQRDGRPRKDGYRVYLDEASGPALQDVWTDIRLGPTAGERLGWGTQKPLALLERIIAVSSNPGDVVLDPFCGCGTALVAAQKLDRRWVGIDVTYLSIAVMKARLKDSFGLADVEVIGQPTEVDGARAMLVGTGLEGQYQFQWWALDLVGAQPQGDTKKKGADKGVDGIINFTGAGGKMGSVIVSVKSGSVGAAMIQQLKGAMETHGAAMGLFVTLEEPTGPMKQEAAIAGTYHSEVSGKDYPRLQILTIRELLEEHRKPDLPPLVLPTYQRAERVEKQAAEQRELFGPG